MHRALLLVSAWMSCAAPVPDRGVVVIAIDGMDPKILSHMIEEGRAPHLAELARRGAFRELGTSTPPQSPVAWSHFITGHRSDVHGIYDFLHRDPISMTPYLSTSKAEGPSFVVEFGDLSIPFGGGVKLLREGEPFWSSLAREGVPTHVVKIPANYPAIEDSDAKVLSGMGTPDLLGTPGLFQLFTTNATMIGRTLNGGRVHPLHFETQQVLEATLDGPTNPLATDESDLTLPIRILRQKDKSLAVIELGEARTMLRVGEWSDWLPIAFSPAPFVPDIRGMVRVHLVELDQHVTLYVSPENFDPTTPAQPISSPPEYAAELAADAGRFYTQGMPEDTKALLSGALSDEEFLAQEEIVFDEHERLLERELAQYRGGFLFVYFSDVDLVSHVFWRSLEPDASPEDARFAHVIPALYEKMDAIVGRTMDAVGDRASIIVMSDHGFAPYRWKVHLNAWLKEHGHLQTKAAASDEMLSSVDWSKTRAYAIGLNQLYLNLSEREPHGTVGANELEAMKSRLEKELLDFVNPETGEHVVTALFRPERTDHSDRVPDLIVGYGRGYRSSDESALGKVGSKTLERNHDKWSGDHCMDPVHVPGVLLTSEAIAPGQWSLIDLAPSIRSRFGLASDGPGRSFYLEK